MNITYQLTQEEYLQAVNVHHKKGRRVVMLTLYAVMATLIVVVGTDFSNTHEVINNIILAFFSISFYVLFVRMLSAYQAKNMYQKSPILPNKVTLHVSGKGIKLDKNRNHASMPWRTFSDWKSDGKFYLLYTNPRQFNVIPARAMSKIEKKELEMFLKRYISQN